MTHKDIYRYLLADLVSYLEYHFIKINKEINKNIKGKSSLKKNTFCHIYST